MTEIEFSNAVAAACIRLGYRVKPTHIRSLAYHCQSSHIAGSAIADKSTADFAIEAWLKRTRREYAGYYENAEPNIPAATRLEQANVALAKQAETAKQRAEAARPAVTLTETEKKFPPHVRHAIISEKAAAAAAELAQKKKTELVA